MAWWRGRRRRRAEREAAQGSGTGPDTDADTDADADRTATPASEVDARQAADPDRNEPIAFAPWRELDGGVYVLLLGSLAADPGVDRILDRCAQGATWPHRERWPVDEAPEASETLRRLVAKEDPAGPEAGVFVGGIINALASLPPADAVPHLVRLADQKSGLTAGSVPAARAAIRALGMVSGELVPPALHRLASESPRAVLRKAAYTELKRRLRTLSDAPEWTADAFGLDADSRTRITVGRDHTAEVEVRPGGRVQVVYRDATGRALAGKPTAATLDPAAMSSVADLANNLRRAVRAAKTRLATAQQEGREIPVTDWEEHYIAHPIMGPLARTLLWEVRRDQEWRAGLPRLVEARWSLVAPGRVRLVLGDGDVLRVVAPFSLTGPDAKHWSKALGRAKVHPVFPQI
ncbi:DUF4132 domain-containing protein [Catenulispora subtropica]|uniref:DUF4132 domain-containing protein n=1 Tax=Catenulispora subtropica TaxID=450798 RepID=A0ABP5D150_9ACTN